MKKELEDFINRLADIFNDEWLENTNKDEAFEKLKTAVVKMSKRFDKLTIIK